MIGVVANRNDQWAVEEFFELFKTPWEWAVKGRRYSVVLSTAGFADELETQLVLAYASTGHPPGNEATVPFDTIVGPVIVAWQDFTFPIYGPTSIFRSSATRSILRCGDRPLECHQESGGRAVRRIGYDLFAEVRYLLEEGQPASHAATPTLELHIARLRSLLLESGVSFVEIPPSPDGHDFICCLTHDVDFFGIRRHTFDRTLAGFLARASVGTLINLVCRKKRVGEAVQNWVALLSLPFVYLGLARDFWHPFQDYARIEHGRPSTFFVVPFKGRPGVSPMGTIDSKRAVPYQLSEIADDLDAALATGKELGVHGIDAWRDAHAGANELRELTSATGQRTAGIRMHWLYLNTASPKPLEAAGFDYDSTWGYNDAVGYRAGTSQVFRLPGTAGLMELPMTIMDSAMFYNDRMGLDERGASSVCSQILENARRFGGALVLNWHCRSLAPERLWGRFYEHLLRRVGEDHRAWFATAAQAVGWFRWRRSIRFTRDARTSAITIVAPARASSWPAALIRVNRGPVPEPASEEFSFDGREPLSLVL